MQQEWQLYKLPLLSLISFCLEYGLHQFVFFGEVSKNSILQNKSHKAAEQMVNGIEGNGEFCKMVFAHPAGGEGNERKGEQQAHIGPDKFWSNMAHRIILLKLAFYTFNISL